MDTIKVLLFIAAGICIIGWLIFSLRAAYHGMGMKMLKNMLFDPSGEFPKLSVIVTARNEEHVIADDLASLLAADYPDTEFIIINDRSTDKTGEIINQFALNDPRITPIHIKDLPLGWIGKVHALHLGTSQASGDWLLYTDADIRFERETLKRSISYAEQEKLDHLSLLPDDRSQSNKLLVPLFVIAFGAMFLVRTQLRNIGKKDSLAFAGVGAFNLVRRTMLEKTPGFEWLKMEVIDDVGLGWMLKKFGAHSAVLSGQNLLSFEWYPTLREAIMGLEKNAFAGFAGYSYWRGIATVMGMWFLVLLPLIIAVTYLNLPLFSAIIFIYYLLPGFFAVVYRRKVQTNPLFVALIPLGYFFVSIAIAGSMIAVWKDGGIRWRETFYPLDELRKGRRVKL